MNLCKEAMEMKAEIMEWTVYGIIEGEQDFQTAFTQAIEYLDLKGTDKFFAERVLCNTAFVAECFKQAELKGGN